jgi:hypothetical protein
MKKNGSSHSLVKTLIISCISLTNTQLAPCFVGAHETKFNGYLQRLNLQSPAISHEKTHNPSKLPSPDFTSIKLNFNFIPLFPLPLGFSHFPIPLFPLGFSHSPSPIPSPSRFLSCPIPYRFPRVPSLFLSPFVHKEANIQDKEAGQRFKGQQGSSFLVLLPLSIIIIY